MFFRYFLQFRNFLSFTAPLPPRHITNSIHIMKYNYMAALFAFLFTIVSVDKFLQMEKLLLNYRPQPTLKLAVCIIFISFLRKDIFLLLNYMPQSHIYTNLIELIHESSTHSIHLVCLFSLFHLLKLHLIVVAVISQHTLSAKVWNCRRCKRNNHV